MIYDFENSKINDLEKNKKKNSKDDKSKS